MKKLLILAVIAIGLLLTVNHWTEPSYNEAVQDSIAAELDCDIRGIPASMSHMRRAQGFVWTSDRDSKINRNICLWTFPADSLPTAQQLKEKHDSVMRINIKGATDSIWMQTSAIGFRVKRTTFRSRPATVADGFWEMNGDLMGGPLRLLAVEDAARRRIVVAEAFVYAPSLQDKTKTMNQLTDILRTLRINK